MLFKNHSERQLNHFVSMPFIYSMIVPIILMDIAAELYKNICFRLYGIELPRRSEYIVVDRQKLSYLNIFEKLNCSYCGYANGVFAYWVRIGAETEKYWCGIQHENEFEESKARFYRPQKHHENFIKYGDEESYQKLNENKRPKKPQASVMYAGE